MPLLQPIVAPLLVAAWLLVSCSTQTTSPAGLPTQTVKLGDRTFHLEIAADNASRVQGLSDRPSLAADRGMLFVFPNERVQVHQFVMRRCHFDIDVLFLGPSGRIVSVHEMKVEPLDTAEGDLKRYSSQWPAQFAIELPAGTIDSLGLKVGQQVELPLAELKRLAR